MHVCLYFQRPLINPSNIVHYAEKMHFYTQEHFLSFRSSVGKKNKRCLSPLKSLPAMLCPPLLCRRLPLVVKSSRNMLLHTSQIPPPRPHFLTSSSKHVRLPRAPAVAHLFFFFSRQMVYWIMQSFVIPAATYSHTSVDTLQYIKARKKTKTLKTGYIQRHLTVL